MHKNYSFLSWSSQLSKIIAAFIAQAFMLTNKFILWNFQEETKYRK